MDPDPNGSSTETNADPNPNTLPSVGTVSETMLILFWFLLPRELKEFAEKLRAEFEQEKRRAVNVATRSLERDLGQ